MDTLAEHIRYRHRLLRRQQCIRRGFCVYDIGTSHCAICGTPNRDMRSRPEAAYEPDAPAELAGGREKA